MNKSSGMTIWRRMGWAVRGGIVRASRTIKQAMFFARGDATRKAMRAVAGGWEQLCQRKEFFEYALLTFSYLVLVSSVYPSLWLGLFSLLIHVGWRFRIDAYRLLPILALPYVFYPLPQTGTYLVLAFVCGMVYSFWGKGEWIKGLLISQRTGQRVFSWGWIVLHLAVVFTLIGSANAFRLHGNLQTFDYDLGVFDNIFFNMMEGRGMFNPLERDDPEGSHLKVHFSPSLYLLLPLYSLLPRAETLQFLQFALIGGAGVILYFLLKRKCNVAVAGVISSAWIFYPPLLGGAFYDFHELCLGPFLLFSAGLSLVRRDKVLPWILAVLTAGVKEDFSLFIAPAFVLLGLWAGRPKTGIGLAFLTLAFFATVRIFWIIPHGENWFHIYHRVGAGNFSDLLKISLTQPWIIVQAVIKAPAGLTALELLAPLCFIPLFSPWSYSLSFLPVLALFVGNEEMKTNHYQYTLLLAPMIFLGLGDLFVRRSFKQGWLVCIAVMTFLSQAGGGILSTGGFRSGFNDVSVPVPINQDIRGAEVQKIRKIIPREASVAAPPHVVSHFSNRAECYTTKYWTQESLRLRIGRKLPLFLITVRDSHFDPSAKYFRMFEGEHFQLWKRMGAVE